MRGCQGDLTGASPTPTLCRGPVAQALYFTINESRFMYGEAVNALIVFILVLGELRPSALCLLCAPAQAVCEPGWARTRP